MEHALDREVREKILLQKSAKQACRTTHKRKQDHPSTFVVCCCDVYVAHILISSWAAGRTADKREHDHLFERRRREWKRLRNGEMRMFTTEPLHGACQSYYPTVDVDTSELTYGLIIAEATVTLYSKNEMYRQLSLYAQV